ncbi:hypothetical protein O3P69_001914 [Scylla paramamosain]|uniref:Uncharacterized protein n=1 Tax=Scylla paramamosain TaxID=85552 RepID=A0AAW0V1A1_SCYPA
MTLDVGTKRKEGWYLAAVCLSTLLRDPAGACDKDFASGSLKKTEEGMRRNSRNSVAGVRAPRASLQRDKPPSAWLPGACRRSFINPNEN